MEEQLENYRKNIYLDNQLIKERKQLELNENDTYQIDDPVIANKEINESIDDLVITDKEINELSEIYESLLRILSDTDVGLEDSYDTSENLKEMRPFIYQKKRSKEELTSEMKEKRRKDLRGKRGGSQLSDKQIERLLLIYKNRHRVPVSQAINKLAITRRTYYRVINLDYVYEETKNRIRKIADNLGVILP